jgi:hypothetical protein
MPAPDALAIDSPGRSDTTDSRTSRTLLGGGASAGRAGTPPSSGAGTCWGLGRGGVASSDSGSVMSLPAGWSRIATTDPGSARSDTSRDCESATILPGRRRRTRRPGTGARRGAGDSPVDARSDGATSSRSSANVAPRMARSTSSARRAMRGFKFSIECGPFLITSTRSSSTASPRAASCSRPSANAADANPHLVVVEDSGTLAFR